MNIVTIPIRPPVLLAITLTACCLFGCLPGEDEPYQGEGPALSGTYQLQERDLHAESCDAEPDMMSLDGYFKLEKQASDGSDILAWYDCQSPDTCDLTHKRNQSFYQPRPDDWRRVSHWAVAGVGECILRKEVATARLDGDSIVIDIREYRETVRGSSDPDECTQSKASTIANAAICARREVTTARVYSGDSDS